MSSKPKHIDDVQPSTVDEHFNVLMNDEDRIDYDETEDLTPTDLPEWYDDELFKAGQRYYTSNVLGLSMAGLSGLIAVLAIPSILKILIYTKKSGTPCTAFRRYLETTLHARVWYTSDSMDKDSNWYKSINTVRWRHCIGNRRSLRDGLGGITQRDMALTQFGFVGYVLLQPKYLGLTNTRKDREGFNHCWRVIGYMLGISDRLNVCRKTEAETTELCRRLQTEVFSKYFKEVPPNFVEMTDTMLDATWSMDMAADKNALWAFTYKLNNVPYEKPLGLYSWLNLKYREIIHQLCGTPYIGAIVRVYFNYFVSFNAWLLQTCPIVAWIQYGKKESQINMYPKLK